MDLFSSSLHTKVPKSDQDLLNLILLYSRTSSVIMTGALV